MTIIAREVRAAAGFLLDESPQHIQIKSGETVHLQFLNRPFGNLIIKKNSSAPTQEAVPGAEFEITSLTAAMSMPRAVRSRAMAAM